MVNLRMSCIVVVTGRGPSQWPFHMSHSRWQLSPHRLSRGELRHFKITSSPLAACSIVLSCAVFTTMKRISLLNASQRKVTYDYSNSVMYRYHWQSIVIHACYSISVSLKKVAFWLISTIRCVFLGRINKVLNKHAYQTTINLKLVRRTPSSLTTKNVAFLKWSRMYRTWRTTIYMEIKFSLYVT